MSSLKVQTRLSAKYLALGHQKLVESGYGDPRTNSELVRVIFMVGLQHLAGNLIQVHPAQEYLDKYQQAQPSNRQGSSLQGFLNNLSGASPDSAESHTQVDFSHLPASLQQKARNLWEAHLQGYTDLREDVFTEGLASTLAAYLLMYSDIPISNEVQTQIDLKKQELEDEQD